ncbi:MAG: hypothetical protein V1889_01400 [archaeon]
MVETRNYEVEMSYNPQRVVALFIRDLYQRYDLESPRVVNLERIEAKRKGVAKTKFRPLSKKSALELTSNILDFPNTSIRITAI